MSTPPCSTPRRVPPPCWTQDETLDLIEAYSDKWYSINRGNLRSDDWDAVAAAVAESSASDPPKSSLQCRHKIEKLRKRYRTEKQRCLNFPGRFFSSWDLFPLLDAMSFGVAGSKQCRAIGESNDAGDGFRVKTFGERYLIASKKYNRIDQDLDPDLDMGLDPDLAFRARKYSRVDGDTEANIARALGNGLCPKSVSDMNSVSLAFRPKDYERIDGKLKPDINFHCEYEGDVCLKEEKKTLGDRSILPQLPRLNGYGNISDVSSLKNRNVGEGRDEYVGFPLRTLGDVPPGYKPKIYRKTDQKSSPYFVNDVRSRGDTRGDKRDRFEENVVDCWESPAAAGFRPNNYCKVELDSKVFNGMGNVKKSGIKKGMDPVKELASATSLCTNTFVKVEKMKMEMAMEIEKMRMDMLLKHNQMILESQQQIVDAFSKTVSENNRKKRKNVEVLSPCRNKNCDSELAATNCTCMGKKNIGK